jgi:hypothetical protein
VRRKRGAKRRGRCEKKAAQEVDCMVRTETDIFKMVGLAYVPHFMRYFHDTSF